MNIDSVLIMSDSRLFAQLDCISILDSLLDSDEPSVDATKSMILAKSDSLRSYACAPEPQMAQCFFSRDALSRADRSSRI